MWGILQQGALRTGGNVGKLGKPVSAGGAAELLVRHSCSNLKQPWRPLVLLHLLQLWHVIYSKVNNVIHNRHEKKICHLKCRMWLPTGVAFYHNPCDTQVRKGDLRYTWVDQRTRPFLQCSAVSFFFFKTGYRSVYSASIIMFCHVS